MKVGKKRKRGRPPLMAGQASTAVLTVRVTPEEHDWLKRLAREHRTTLTVLVLSALREAYPRSKYPTDPPEPAP